MTTGVLAAHVHAVSCGALVDRSLAGGAPTGGVVHAVFASSAYVLLDHGGMVLVHDLRHGHTPASILVAAPGRITTEMRQGAPVLAEDGVLHLGGAAVDLRGARRRRSAPRGPVDLAVLAGRPSGPVDQALAADHDTSQRLGLRLAALDAALHGRDAAAVARAVHDLVGYGPGLTPSGDDALVGVATVLHRAAAAGAPTGALRLLLTDAVTPRLGRTTPISAHHLALALDGHSGEHLTALVDEWLDLGTPAAATVARVRAVGATSGADALVGVGCGMRLVGAIAKEVVA